MADYATLVMAHIGRHSGQVHSAQQLADDLGLGAATVSKVLKKLSAAELVQATRGTRGGYALAMPVSSINMRMVVEAIDGPVRVSHLLDNAPTSMTRLNMLKLNNKVMEALENIALADIICPATTAHFQPTAWESLKHAG